MKRCAVFLVLTLTAACASEKTATQPQVLRTDEAVDLSGEWNDVDADSVAKAMIEDCLTSPWIQEWRNSHDQRRPVVRLYPDVLFLTG